MAVQVDVETNFANEVGATLAPTGVGIFTTAEPDNSPATPYNLGVSLQHGMSITVTGGSLGSSLDSNDFFLFNTGSATTVTFMATWSPSASVTASALDTGGLPLALPATQSATGSTSNTSRLVNLQSPGPYPGTYALIITAN